MPQLTCTARRIRDYESRTEEYELTFAAGDAEPQSLEIKYQAARAFEINAALDSSVETARAVLAKAYDPEVARRSTEESLAQLAWKTLQSAKYGEGAPQQRVLEL